MRIGGRFLRLMGLFEYSRRFAAWTTERRNPRTVISRSATEKSPIREVCMCDYIADGKSLAKSLHA